ncbi:hypothetical protein EBV26_08820 [bacterium]|nr:hypothetical protein [bacterium]
MSAWGKYDDKTSAGTISIDSDGIVTGSGTNFNPELSTGDFIKTADGKSYICISVTSDTVAKVINADPELGAITTQSGVEYTISEKPTSIASDPNTLASQVFGVDQYEIHGDQAGGYVSAVALIQGGTRYLEAPSVSFSGGGGSGAAATATIAAGSVTAIAVTNNGSSYETAPSVFVGVPRRTITTANVNTSTETLTYNNHGLTAGEEIKYYHNGGTAIAGLTNAVSYYPGQVTTNTFKLYNTAARGTNAVATMTISTTNVNTTSNTFTSTAHGLVNGAELNYSNQGGTTITGLTSGNDYFVVNKTNDTFQLALTSGGDPIDISGTGNNSQTFASTGMLNLTGTGNNNQYFDLMTATTATANAALGVNQGDGVGASGAVAHTGWVKRKVLTGRHAGRIQYEVLVAQSKNAGIVSDAADDIEFPED